MNEDRSPIGRPARNVISSAACRVSSGVKLSCGVRAATITAALLLLSVQTSRAGSAKWKLNPGSIGWNTATNWMPATVPNGPTDIATFGVSNITGVFLSVNTEVSEILFNANASSFTITDLAFIFTISGPGITNNSGITQNFVVENRIGGYSVFIRFTNSAAAGSSTSFTNIGGTGNSNFGGITEFFDTSTADHGTFINNGGTEGGFGGFTNFSDFSTAADGTFIVNGGAADHAIGGSIRFFNASTAGNGTFTVNGGSVSGSGGSNTSGGVVVFTGSSSAGNGSFTINGTTVGDAFGGDIQFQGDSTAANGIFINNGATAPVFGGLGGGGLTRFSFNSTAGNAVLIANGGSNGGNGGGIVFTGDSTGGTARVQVFGNGYLYMYIHNPPGVTVGSLEGDGEVFLGGTKLTVGSNNLSTTFSGLIQDGSPNGGTGGSLRKIGSGTLRFSGANIYTGPTTVKAGRLLANNFSGSGTGSGAVTVNNNGSVLGGTGTISGPVTVNSGAALLSGNAISVGGGLRVANNLTLNFGSIIQLVLGAAGTHSTLSREGGTWSFAPDQRFTFIDLGAQPGLYDNIITGLAGDPAGEATWTITNAGFTGTFSYDGGGNIDLNLTAASGPVLQLISALSRKTHGVAGIFNINLPLTGEPGVECRNSGGNHTLRFTFTNDVESGNASVTTGVGTVSGTPNFAGNKMTVNLTGVADVQTITVTLSNVRDSLAQVLPDKAVSMNMLIGDTTANKVVNASDISQTKAQSGTVVTAANFRQDVTVNGSINASDIGLVKSRSGAGVP